jgi:vacuolar-type H+-ATPase subunit H
MIEAMVRNPIQEVLAAEREAKGRIDTIKRDADNALAGAHRRAKSIRDRNDERTKHVLSRFEQEQKRLTEQAAEDLRREAEAELREYECAVTDNLERLVDRTFKDFWPA